jgi:hypothetical protein
MDRAELQQRTKPLARRVIKLVEALPRTITGEGVGKQLLRTAKRQREWKFAGCRGSISNPNLHAKI